MTGGRTQPGPAGVRFDLIALVTLDDNAPGPEDDTSLGPEHRALIELCRTETQSVAELAAGADLPVGVVRVLLGDLLEMGCVKVSRPVPPAQLPDEKILREVIDGAPRRSDATGGDTTAMALKILVAGGFGVGKTTLVGAVSEIRPLRTEELLSEAGQSVDDTGGVDRKTTTTVAMDFGRITIRSGLSLYLFGTPGQDRFWFLWDELSQGALGAVVLADTRRLEDCFPAVDYFEHRHIPFVVAVNCFANARTYGAHEVSRALDLDRGTPVVLCDARDRDSGKEVLIRLVEYAGRMHTARLLDTVG